MNPETESFLQNSDFETVSVSGLDNDFTPEEIISAIDSLKRGKGAGYDNLLPGSCSMRSKTLYPISWTKILQKYLKIILILLNFNFHS